MIPLTESLVREKTRMQCDGQVNGGSAGGGRSGEGARARLGVKQTSPRTECDVGDGTGYICQNSGNYVRKMIYFTV